MQSDSRSEVSETAGSSVAVRDRLAEVVERSGLEKKQIALRAGKRPQWLSDRLTGHSPIYADDLTVLARVMKVHPCDLLPDPDDDPEPPLRITGERAGHIVSDTLRIEWGLEPHEVEAIMTIVEGLARRA